jgi:hypothetical protein
VSNFHEGPQGEDDAAVSQRIFFQFGTTQTLLASRKETKPYYTEEETASCSVMKHSYVINQFPEFHILVRSCAFVRVLPI